MLKHILLPEKINNYFLFKKRVLSLEINQVHVQATLFVYNGRSVTIEKSESLFLADFSLQSIESGIKKITSSMKYDEIVTSISSSLVVFKEIELPFVGREKIEMIIGFEVEPFLPFSYQDAVIDFITLSEDNKNNRSKVLVAAVRKSDVEAVTSYFTKAQLSVDKISVDVFSFYKVYQSVLHKPEKKVSELFINIGLDSTSVIYMNQGIFSGVRVIPLGVASIAQKISGEKSLGYYDVIQDLLQEKNLEEHRTIISKEIGIFVRQLKMSMKFFEKSSENYQEPHHIFLYGLGSCLPHINDMIQDKLSLVVNLLDLNQLLKLASVKVKSKATVQLSYVVGVLLGVSIGVDDETNFLAEQKSGEQSRLFLRQFILLCILTLGGFGLLYWSIHVKISELRSIYNVSKREMVRTIENSMGMKIQRSKSPRTIVTSVQDTFQQEKELWFSLSQQSFLEYLKKLSKIDQVNLGLELTKVQMTYDTIVLEGSVSDTSLKTSWENLTALQETLGVVQMFTIVEKPTQPNNFSMKIKISREDES